MLAYIDKQVLHDFRIHFIMPGSFRSVAFSILSHVLTQIFILGNVFKEKIALLLCCISYPVWIGETAKCNLRRICRYKDQIVPAYTVTVKISAVCIRIIPGY